ncbi:hypothetical protein [Frigoriglobus tundricola]|uniref:Uncharacterized protein n=1 Tax=Frigoriglobus tundricola TaxID=2774151 RepID=A0A6M5YIC1_9BACT|nr:hypothetical protein [Frigoriglobus tundricola]QJW93785.1 hypothetical protein FTUN_1296 [Frigoriglobus tundricola]
MTEDEWLAGPDPGQLLPFLHGRLSPRKLRLLGVACCRALGPLLPDEADRTAITIAEQYADGQVSRKALQRAHEEADEARYHISRSDEESVLAWPPPDVTRLASWGDEEFARSRRELISLARWFVFIVIDPGLANLRVFPQHPYLPYRRFVSPFTVWDVAGNPFRPTPHDPAWLTADVTALARGIYEQRAFDRAPILADALQDAGCEDEGVLDHLRGGGSHARGCWAVDLVLGKE